MSLLLFDKPDALPKVWEIHPLQREDLSPMTIFYTIADTNFGKMLLAGTSKGICYVTFIEKEEEDLHHFKKEFSGAVIKCEQNEMHDMALRQIETGMRNEYPTPLHVIGTDFQYQVWNALLQIPPGKTTNYQHLAKLIGKPAASRAVGTAIGKNPVAILIPCHRVVRSDGGISGFRWGSDRKRMLLEWEARAFSKL